MNLRLFLSFVALLLALSLSACLANSPPSEDLSLVQPGTTTRPLGPLYFQNPAGTHSNTTGEPIPFTACKMAQNAGSIVLVEFLEKGELIPVHEDCTGPYSGDVLAIPTQIYGVAAGEPIPSDVELLFNVQAGPNGLDPKAGSIWLVTARQSEGRWFITNALAVAMDENGSIATTPPTSDHELSAEFSSDFYALSDNLVEKLSNLNQLCPVEAGQRWDDETFREYYYNPRARPISNCHPTSGPQQQNSSEIDEEDLPPNGGTDDSIQP